MGSVWEEPEVSREGGGRMCRLYGVVIFSSHHKDAGSLNMSDVVSAVASKMTSAVLGKLSQAG